MALTDTQIRKHLKSGKTETIRDSHALFLRVGDRGASWLCRHTRNGKTTKTVIGHYPKMTATRARLERDRLTGQNTDLSITVEDAVNEYRHLVSDRQKSGYQTEVYLRDLVARYGDRRIATLDRATVVNAIRTYSRERGARSADRYLSTLRGVFNLALEQGQIDVSPLQGVTKRVTGYEPNPRARVLTDDEIRSVWAWEHRHGALCRFLLLTGLRISEAQKGHREGDKWIVPAKHSKNKREHWVYLTPTAMQQLATPFETSPTAVQAWIRRRADVDGWTPHDLRRTASTRMADSGINPFIVERCLGHTLQGVMAIYNRAEYEAERIEAAQTLERVLLGVVK